jgi:hypothetical protein
MQSASRNPERTTMPNFQSNSATNIPLPSPEQATARLRYREAYQRVLPERSTLDPTQLVVINIDVTSSYTTVIGALPRIATFRERANQLIEFDIKNFDSLETYALALMHAQGEYVAASTPPEGLIALHEAGVGLRDNLYSDALALAHRGLINGEPLKDFKTAPGYKNLAEDLVGLSALLRRSWEKIGARTMITIAELAQAEDLSDRLLQALAMRERASNALADAIHTRLQVFTLFVNAYDQVRRAISFLRWLEDDVDAIAPSLYAGRGRNKRGLQKRPGPPTPDGNSPGIPMGASHSWGYCRSAPTPESTSEGPQGAPCAESCTVSSHSHV